MNRELERLSLSVGHALQQRGWLLATAESCTGGGIAAAVTAIAGSSAWFDRGFVTYSNAAKRDMLGVREATLRDHGAVSEAVVLEMASGALAHSNARITVAVSGIAGPSGDTAEKPAGTVCIALALRDDEGQIQTATARFHFPGDRESVRQQTVMQALKALLDAAEGETILQALCHNR